MQALLGLRMATNAKSADDNEAAIERMKAGK